MEIALISTAAFALMILSFMDRKKAQLQQQRQAVVEATCNRLRSLESICLELQQRYRSPTIEQFLNHQTHCYLEELSRYRNDHSFAASYEDWCRRVGKMRGAHAETRADQGNDPAAPAESPAKALIVGENSTASSYSVEVLRDSKYLLKDLHRAVADALNSRLIAAPAAMKLFEAIKFELLAVGIDTYEQAARNAMAKDDLSLAKHCYMMALKRLQSSPLRAKMKKREQQLQQSTLAVIQRLEGSVPGSSKSSRSRGLKQAQLPAATNEIKKQGSSPATLADKFDQSMNPAAANENKAKDNDKSWQKKRY